MARRVETVESDVDEQVPGRDFSLPVGPELFAMSDPEATNNDDPTPQDVLDVLEQDLVETEGPPSPLSRVVVGRRLVLVP